MPFTPTHTLAVVPLAFWWRRPAMFSSMIIGSMIPDWPLYVPIGPGYALTHSIGGLFQACLPLGLVAVFFFQFALKRPLFELMPDYLGRRLARYLEEPRQMTLGLALVVSSGLLVGAASHILWDSFTHRGAWGVQTFPALNDVTLSIGSLRFRTYMVLQHGSTLVGVPIFLVLAYWWCRNADVRDLPARRLPVRALGFWRVLLLAIPAATLAHMLWELSDPGSIRSVFRILYLGVTRAGLLLLIALIGLGLHFRITIQTGLRTAAGETRRGG